MRNVLIRNYWLMIIAWIMCLNDNLTLALMFSVTACVMVTITIYKRINIWRMLAIALMIYMSALVFLSSSNILYYFPKLKVFFIFVSIDASLTNELIYRFKVKYLYPFLMFMILVEAVLSIIIFILPNELYSLFTKNSLYLMELLIFGPFEIEIIYCILLKSIRKQALIKDYKYVYIMEKIKKSA